MRLLDRYLLRELLVPFGYCLGGFFVFWVSFDLINELGEFQNRRLRAPEIAQYYLVKAPEMIVFVLPVALLLALLYTLTNHARHHELTAMRAAGVSLWRLAAPYFAVGLLCSAALFALNELWVPGSNVLAHQILHRHDSAQINDADRNWEKKIGFDNKRENRTWLAEQFNLVSGEMVRPHVVWTLPNGIRREIMAERATFSRSGWSFTNAQELIYAREAGVVETRSETNLLVMVEFSETPEEIQQEVRMNSLRGSFKEARRAQLSIRQILDYKKARGLGREPVLDTKLHGRWATPWTCLIVVLIALPFGAGSGRRNVSVGVASSIVIGFVYFVLQQLALALGAGGYVWPALAAWLPNLLFATTGVVLTWRVR